MPAITFDDFAIGLDRRKGRGVADANRLYDLKNAYVTPGKAIKKRPGFTLVATLSGNTKGLIPYDGKLNLLVAYGSSNTVSTATFQTISLGTASSGFSTTLARVHDAEIYNGVIYSAAEDGGGAVKHHYGTTLVAQTSCPSSKSILRASERIFAIDPATANNNVSFCEVGVPTTWAPATSAAGAGFLPTGLQAPGDPTPEALGLYQKQLAVINSDSIQTWNLDPDQGLMSLSDVIPNIGTRYPASVVNVAGDLYLLSDLGFRSVSLLTLTQNLAEIDVGTPVDSLVRAQLPATYPRGVYVRSLGQYWCAIGTTIWVYSFSRTAKVSAWSYYTVPWSVDDVTELDGVVYVRSGQDVYKLDETAYQDANGAETAAIEVIVEMPFLDFKKPGQLKHILGADIVISGTASLTFRYDAQTPASITDAMSVTGDSRSQGLLPVELLATEIAPKLVHSANEAFQLDQLSLYYEVLGTM